MAPAEDGSIEDRRGTDRRITALEQQYASLTSKVDKVGLEQGFQRELFGTRFSSLEKGQELVSAQVGALSQSIQLMASDVGNSPAGRAINKELVDLRHDYAEALRRIDKLESFVDKLDGACTVAGRWGMAGVGGFALTAVLVLLKAMKVIP